MGKDKKAFVFDTNFIVQNLKLYEVIDKIDEDYVPYITQVSIEERKAQQCILKKKAYGEVLKLHQELKSIITIKSRTTFDAELIKHKEYVQSSYETLFKDHIIRYDISSELFALILQRAYEKTAPFNDSDGASDKGFKDTLMWLSIMAFFKDNGENEVIFLTDDNGFHNKIDALTKEFEEYTGKKIQIKKNSAFGSLFVNKKETVSVPKKEIPNIESIREQLRDLLENICWVTEYNYFGDEEYYRSFLTSVQFDNAYIKTVMDDLDKIIQENLFSDKIQVSVFLNKDGRIYNDRRIDIAFIEKLHRLYKDTMETYPEHTSAFLKNITEKLNENYEEVDVFDNAEVPF